MGLNFNPISQIFKHLTISIIFMFIGVIIGKLFIPPSFIAIANTLIIVLGIVLIIMSICSRKGIIPRSFSMNFVYLFTFIDGILIYPCLEYYLQDLGFGIFTGVILGAVAIFTILALLSYKAPAGQFLGIGKILFAGLIGILLATLLNLFFTSNILYLVISIVSLLIFCGYVLYDISLIKYELQNGFIQDKNDLSYHVLNLYLDIINIILDLLRIASSLDD